jgi:hypothetical protein
MAYISHNGNKYPIPEGASPQDALDSLSQVLPELSNAKLEKDGENYKATTNFGRKG